MKQIIAIELTFGENKYRIYNDESSIKIFDSIIRNISKTNKDISIKDHFIGFSIIRTNEYALAYSYSGGIIYLMFNKKHADKISIIDNTNYLYKINDLIHKIDILEINETNLSYFENMNIRKDGIISWELYDCKLEFKYNQ